MVKYGASQDSIGRGFEVEEPKDGTYNFHRKGLHDRRHHHSFVDDDDGGKTMKMKALKRMEVLSRIYNIWSDDRV